MGASTTNNPGTDGAATSDSTMNNETNTHDGIAPASTETTTRTVPRTEVVASGTPVNV